PCHCDRRKIRARPIRRRRGLAGRRLTGCSLILSLCHAAGNQERSHHGRTQQARPPPTERRSFMGIQHEPPSPFLSAPPTDRSFSTTADRLPARSLGLHGFISWIRNAAKFELCAVRSCKTIQTVAF